MVGRVRVHKNPKSARALIRRHLREDGKTISKHLREIWGVSESTAYTLMCAKNWQMPPYRVEEVIKGLQLDEFDANELRLAGARDAGWMIDLKFVIDNR